MPKSTRQTETIDTKSQLRGLKTHLEELEQLLLSQNANPMDLKTISETLHTSQDKLEVLKKHLSMDDGFKQIKDKEGLIRDVHESGLRIYEIMGMVDAIKEEGMQDLKQRRRRISDVTDDYISVDYGDE